MKQDSSLIPRAVAGLLLAWTITLGALPLWGQRSPSIPIAARKPESLDPAADLFKFERIPRLTIEIAEKDWDKLSDYRWGGRGDNGPRPSVKATVREGANTYREVEIHLKGSAGSFRPLEDKPGLTLNFDKHVKGQSFHGLKRLSLNNSVQDPSYLCEQFSRELYAAAGVPVPRATHALVTLNQRDLGLYVLLEAYNKQFLRRAFTNDTGHLYDGGFVRDIDDGLELSSGENPKDRSDLERLAAAIAAESGPADRLNRLGKILDLDRFLSLLAMDVMLCNSDGYAMNRNNYRIYHDPISDRLVFMPHGLDQMLGTFRCSTSLPIFPHMEGMVARAVLQTAEGRQRYRKRLAELYTRLYRVDALTNRVQQMAAAIGSTTAKNGERTGFRPYGANLQRRIVERGRSLEEQLNRPNRTLSFDGAGIARLEGWKFAADFGEPAQQETQAGDGTKCLQITADAGSCVGSWKTRVSLEPGEYRFEGRIRCQGVAPEPGDRRGGAALRTSSQRAQQKLTGDQDWTKASIRFEVNEESADVELRCELRAVRGEAGFDRHSLRLIRE